MKILTTTLCLTVAVLLGSVEVTFASDYYQSAGKVIIRFGVIALMLALGAAILWLIIKIFKDIEFSHLNILRVIFLGVGCLGFYDLDMRHYGPNSSIFDYVEISFFVFCLGFSLYPLARKLWK
jgi:hypothetical protein